MNAQKAYNSHIWPKYPNAAVLNLESLKTFKKVREFNFCEILMVESGIKIFIQNPPNKARIEVE